MSFISTAYAMGAGPAAGGEANALAQFMPLILVFAVFYFLLIRPQQKKAKDHREMIAGMKKGDKVLTAGGMFGRIVDISGDTVVVDLGDVQVNMGKGYLTVLGDKKKAAAPAAKKDKKSKKEKAAPKEAVVAEPVAAIEAPAAEAEAPAAEVKNDGGPVVSGNDSDKPAVQ